MLRAQPAIDRVAADDLGDVVITGAAGFIGSALVRTFSSSGAAVHAVVRPGRDADHLRELDCKILEADLTREDDVAGLFAGVEPVAVVHAAASPGHPTEADDRAEAWQANLIATTHILRHLLPKRDARLVLVGSSTEYRPSDQPLSERSTCEPLTVRGASKYAATVAVRQWAAEFGRAAVVVRPFSVYGQREPRSRLMPTLVRAAQTGTPFEMLDGVSRRDLVHVDDVAEGCVRALAVAGADAPIVNLGTGDEHTVDDARRVVEEVIGLPIVLAEQRRRPLPHDVRHWVADVSECRRLLGWVPSTPLAVGVARMATAAA